MSTFDVYTSKNSDPKKVGKRNRIFYWLTSMIFASTGLVVTLLRKLFSENTMIVVLIIYLIVAAIITFLAFYYFRRLKKIGSIEINKASITKNIGGYKETWHIDDINKISITEHTREFIQRSPEGMKSYILSIQFKNDNKLNLIVGCNSNDSPNTTVKKLLKLISKLNNKLIIESK